MRDTTLAPSTIPILRASWIVLAIFILTNSATPLYNYWQGNFGFSSVTITFVFGAYILGLLLTLAFSGPLSDHYGRKAVLIPCIVLALISTLMFRFAPSVEVLIMARLLTGIAVGLVVSAGMANVFDHAGSSHRKLASLMASTAMVAGCGVGPLFAGILLHAGNSEVHWIFDVELVVIASALIAVLMQRNVKLGSGKFNLRFMRLSESHRRTVFRGVIFFAPGITTTSLMLSLGPKILSYTERGVENPMMAGIMSFAMFMSALVTQLLIKNQTTDIILKLSASATVAAVISILGATVLHSEEVLFVGALFGGTGMGLGQLGGLSLIASHVPTEKRAEVNAAFNMVGYLPAGLLPVAVGYLFDVYSLPVGIATFSILITMSVIAASLMFIGDRESVETTLKH